MRSILRGSRRLSLMAALGVAGVAAAVVASVGGAATTDTTTATTTTGTTTTTATTTAAAAPQSTSPPTLSGTPQAGQVLTAQPGAWNGTAPITYTYAWTRCDADGGSCADISGATASTYKLTSADVGNTVRIVVTAHNAGGSSSATSVPSARIASAPAPAPATGCPSTPKGQAVAVKDVSLPARLQITSFQSSPGALSRATTTFTLRVGVSDGCGHPVSGALVYVTAVPYNQFSIPAEAPTGSDGTVTLTLAREPGFPATARQQLLALFVRARKPGENVLSGISTRRLVSVAVARR